MREKEKTQRRNQTEEHGQACSDESTIASKTMVSTSGPAASRIAGQLPPQLTSMTTFAASRNLRASPDEVFDTVAHIDQLAQALPHVIRYEFLTEQTRGVGTRFRDVRQMGKREQPTDLEITEYIPCERVRLISVAGGTLWDTVFQVKQVGDATQLDLTMDAIAKNPLAWLMNALIEGMIQKALEKDMDYIQEYCNAKSR